MLNLKNKIKMICSDIDGTLIRDDQTISKRNLDAIKKAMNLGIKFALVTGRFKTGAKTIIDQLGLGDNEFSGVYDNGAYVEANGESVHAEGVPTDLLHEITRKAEKYKARGVLFFDDAWIVEEKDRWWARINGFYEGRGVVEPFKETFRKARTLGVAEPVKLVLRHDVPEEMFELKESLRSEYPNLLFFLSHPDILEVSLSHIDKGTGVRVLADRFGIGLDNVMAFGDFDNDVPMLKEVGCGIAMANGTRDALLSADYITKSNNEDGLALVLEEYILK